MKRALRIHSFSLLVPLVIWAVLPPIAQSATKDALVYVMGSEAVSLDPHNERDSISQTVIRHIFDLPLHPTLDGKLLPALFTQWEHSPDGLTWTFHLRKGVTFHDGTPFNAEAVRFNWQRATDTVKIAQMNSFFSPWAQNIKVIDDYTIQTSSEKPFAPILQFLAHPSMGFLSPEALKKYGDHVNRNPVGTGPFRFVDWKPGERLVLERNETFWGPKPAYRQIIFRFVKESGARVMMLETGEADLVLKIPPADIERLRKNATLEIRVDPSNRVMGFYVNTAAPLVNDVRFRKALLHSIDTESIIKHVMKGIARPCCSVIGGGTFGAATPTCYDYNPEKAKQLLKEAGYKGEKLQLWTPQGRYEMDREVSEAVQGFLSQAGINVELRVMEFATLLRELGLPPDKVKYQIALLGVGAVTGDGDSIFRTRYHSSQIPPQGGNFSRYRNPEFDKVAEAQAMELDVQKRLEFMKACQELLARDLPYIPLYTVDQVIGTHKRLKGVEILPIEMSIVREAHFQE